MQYTNLVNFNNLFEKISNGFSTSFFGSFSGFFDGFVGTLKTIASIISVLAIFVICYCIVRIMELNKKKQKDLASIMPIPPLPKQHNTRWDVVSAHITSENPSDWKIAIMEADLILDEMVEKMGYKGENLGERLKNVEPSDFTTIQYAWEAHKIRNQIAHQGSEFQINQHQAKQVINMYREVFREFEFI